MIKPEPDASIPSETRGFVVAESLEKASFIAMANKAEIVESMGSVEGYPNKAFVAWDFDAGCRVAVVRNL